MTYKNSRHTFIAWTAVLVWMLLIFYLSHQPATESSEISKGFTDMMIHLIKTMMIHMAFNFDNFHFFIRKSAHFFAYFILGMLVINAIRINYYISFRTISLALIICITYALSDEVHQLFIAGRSGEVRDVMIDSAGSVVGISMYLLFIKTFWKQFLKDS